MVIPNGSPVVYKFDPRMKPLKQSDSIGLASCSFLEDAHVLDKMIGMTPLYLPLLRRSIIEYHNVTVILQ